MAFILVKGDTEAKVPLHKQNLIPILEAQGFVLKNKAVIQAETKTDNSVQSEQKKKKRGLSAKDAIKKLQAAKNVEELEAALIKGEKRKTVLPVYEQMKKKLSK